MATGEKSPGAFKTIGELSQELGVAQHILRYWETKFPQLRPLQRAGNRRYYRPSDVELARRIHRLLNHEGYTVRGVQQLLRSRGARDEPSGASVPQAPPAQAPEPKSDNLVNEQPGVGVDRLIALRDRLAQALEG